MGAGIRNAGADMLHIYRNRNRHRPHAKKCRPLFAIPCILKYLYHNKNRKEVIMPRKSDTTVPAKYAVCIHNDCPKAKECLRQMGVTGGYAV